MRQRRMRIEDERGLLDLAWFEHGDPDADRTVLCVHGLTRNAHDFDLLGARLAASARVIAIDVPGRGASSWLNDPEGYTVPDYARQLRSFIEALELDSFDWVGTSMGGLIAMEMQRDGGLPCERLVLNDIGPFLPASQLALIAGYLGLDQRFDDIAAAEAHLRVIHAGFGPLSDERWRQLAEHSVRRCGSQYKMHYDPDIKIPFLEQGNADIEMWDAFDAITCPTLLLRGTESNILDEATAAAMTTRGPKARRIDFKGVGHAPSLMVEDQIEAVAGFLGL